MLPLHDLRFRANPLMELTQLASLTDAQREPFRDLESDPDFYGLFVPQPPLTITIKSAPRQTAELFRSLAAPAHLDRALLGDGDAAANIVDLVLDGILEIERGDGFVSGADALPFLPAGAPDAGGVLSRRALLHAQELETADPRMLASALYRYNCIPLTPSWRSRSTRSAPHRRGGGPSRGRSGPAGRAAAGRPFAGRRAARARRSPGPR